MISCSLLLAFTLNSFVAAPWVQTGYSGQIQNKRELRVPEQHKTIQAAIDAAENGAVVLVAPGVYHEELRIAGKSVVLASWYLKSGDPKHIRSTVLDGTITPDPDPDDDIDPILDQVILVEKDAGANTAVVGFTIRDGDDGISCHAKISILFNHFVNNVDAIDYEGGGGECRFNTFTSNDDDAVDLDESCEVLVADNQIRDNDDDGIEIRLHDYRGKPLQIVIRGNIITGNGEDGIQIIDYAGISDRVIRIERNVICGNAMAGIGCMSNANTVENFEGADIPERIEIVNNTICENQYGITGGNNSLVINNILAGHAQVALKKVDGRSSITHNLFWNNGGGDSMQSNTQRGKRIQADPRLDGRYRPPASGVCHGAGAVQMQFVDGKLAAAPQSYSGPAPELGAFELD